MRPWSRPRRGPRRGGNGRHVRRAAPNQTHKGGARRAGGVKGAKSAADAAEADILWEAAADARAWKASIYDQEAWAERRKGRAIKAEADESMKRAAKACRQAAEVRCWSDAAATRQVVARVVRATEVLDLAADAFRVSFKLGEVAWEEMLSASEEYRRAGNTPRAVAAAKRATRSYNHAIAASNLAIRTLRGAKALREGAVKMAEGAAELSRGDAAQSETGSVQDGIRSALSSVRANLRGTAGWARAVGGTGRRSGQGGTAGGEDAEASGGCGRALGGEGGRRGRARARRTRRAKGRGGVEECHGGGQRVGEQAAAAAVAAARMLANLTVWRICGTAAVHEQSKYGRSGSGDVGTRRRCRIYPAAAGIGWAAAG